MTIGCFVEYKKGKYMICAIIADKAKIISPTLGKKFVKMVNLTYLNAKPAVHIIHKDNGYLVTGLGTIVSCTTLRIMKWDRGNGDAKAILAKAYARL
jgi:hypothetical protein